MIFILPSHSLHVLICIHEQLTVCPTVLPRIWSIKEISLRASDNHFLAFWPYGSKLWEIAHWLTKVQISFELNRSMRKLSTVRMMYLICCVAKSTWLLRPSHSRFLQLRNWILCISKDSFCGFFPEIMFTSEGLKKCCSNASRVWSSASYFFMSYW